MKSWRWIDRRALLRLHEESMAEHGGAAGIRDRRLLTQVLARPSKLLAGGSPDVAALAAAYGAGLAKNPAFVAGNSRAALLASGLFLALNGHRLVATQADAAATVLDLAAGSLAEEEFAAWIRAHVVRG